VLPESDAGGLYRPPGELAFEEIEEIDLSGDDRLPKL
jgi:hypothetical protein